MKKETKLRLRELVNQLSDIPRAAEIAKEINFAVSTAWTEGQVVKEQLQNQGQILSEEQIARKVKEQVNTITEDYRNQFHEKMAELEAAFKERELVAEQAMAKAGAIIGDWWKDKYEYCRQIESLIIVGVGDITKAEAFDASAFALALMAIDENGSYKINDYHVLIRVSEHGMKMVVTVFTEDSWRKAKDILVVGTVQEYVTFSNKLMKKAGFVWKDGRLVPKDIMARHSRLGDSHE